MIELSLALGMSEKVPSVSSVIGAIKNSLESNFRQTQVVGEVSNLSTSGAGHYYFTLSDSRASLSCCLFRADAMRNSLINNIKNGDQIIASGSIGVYAKRGSFQLIAKSVSAAGQGALALELEQLKKKLAGEGLFDMSHKKKISRYPVKIGLISAHKSAAYFDFLNVAKRRACWLDIIFAPATVQGDKAATSLRSALEKLIRYHLEKSKEERGLDVIVITRGGGSLEDLWAFNDEALAWDIYNCPIPIISAIGHDVDFSISDYVADLRCETPTAAAEVLTQAQVELVQRMNQLNNRLLRVSKTKLVGQYYRLEKANVKGLQRRLENKFYQYQKRLDRCDISNRLEELSGLHDNMMALEDCRHGLEGFGAYVEKLKTNLEHKNTQLKLLGPKNVLARGYSFVQGQKGEVVSSAKAFKKLADQTPLTLTFYDGLGLAQVKRDSK